ncbi:MAG TPA: nucleotide kinase domain-containing protein [Burkholderiales bacterium]|nr:nucleotide kinase domain-containing protein [Burkholderiales bacterium]
MTINPAELDILVSWMLERDRIRAAKEAGQPKPWTDDPLLRDYRWCNVRRMDDRVSRWLFEHWYGDRDDPDEQLIAAAWARLINWPEALAEMDTWRHPIEARRILEARAGRKEKVFTGAYVIPGAIGQNKVKSICALVQAIGDSSERILANRTARDTWTALIAFNGLGPFLAGQIVADLAALGVGDEWPDKHTWAPIGPGSARGMNRLLGRAKDQRLRQPEFEALLRELVPVVRARVETLWVDRGLIAMDVQNCLCEYDKYRRLDLGEGKVRARYDGAGAPQPSLL